MSTFDCDLFEGLIMWEAGERGEGNWGHRCASGTRADVCVFLIGLRVVRVRNEIGFEMRGKEREELNW